MLENRIRRLVLMLLIGILTFPVMANPNVVRRGLNVYLTDNPPEVDGKMDDECWKDASKTQPFLLQMQKGKAAKEQTEVLICYDIRNIYLFWKVYESNMAGMKHGPAADKKDHIQENEAIYLYLNPNRCLNGYFRFGVSPRGAKYDEMIDYLMSDFPAASYDGNWQAKTGRFNGGWTVEMAIPFSELFLPNRFSGTPEAGDAWGVNFCRLRSQGEASQWSLTAGNFVCYGCFGSLVFDGDANGRVDPQLFTDKTELKLGKNLLKFQFKDSVADGVLSVETVGNGKKVNQITQKVSGHKTRKISIPLIIANGGKWDIKVSYKEKDREWYYGTLCAELPPVFSLLKEVKEQVAVLLKKYRQVNPTFLLKLQHSLEKIDKELKNVSWFQNLAPEKFSDEQWQQLVKASDVIKSEWDKTAMDRFLLKVFPVDSKGKAFNVLSVNADAKVYPDKPFAGKVETNPQVYLAGNETRSFQLLVVPFGKDLTNIKVKFSDFKNGSGVLSETQLKWYMIEPVKFKLPGRAEHRMEPDILMPGKLFDLKSGTIRSVFVNVTLPKGVSEGQFKGKIIVSCDQGEIIRESTVNALGFDIPDKMSLKHNHWLTRGSFGRNPVTPQRYEEAMKMLTPFRAQCFYFDHGTLFKKIKFFREKDGSYSFDFSGLDPYLDIGKKYHCNAWWSAMTCGPALLAYFAKPGQKIIYRATGKTVTLYDCPDMKAWIDEYSADKPEFKVEVERAVTFGTEEQNEKIFFDSNPVWKAFLKAYVAYLKEKGINEYSYFEIYDEAPQRERRWVEMIKHHRFLKKWVPELRLFNYEVNPNISIREMNAHGLVCAWAPQLFQCDNQKMLDVIKERREKFGEEYWFYVCSEKIGGIGKYTPYNYLHRPSIGCRIVPWFGWWLGRVDGFLVYALNLLVTWRDGALRPSVRLAMLRDGMQDFEYFVLLADLLKKLDRKKYPTLAVKVEKELRIEPEIIDSIFDWTKSIEQLDHKRLRLATLIVELKKLTQ